MPYIDVHILHHTCSLRDGYIYIILPLYCSLILILYIMRTLIWTISLYTLYLIYTLAYILLIYLTSLKGTNSSAPFERRRRRT